MSYPSSLSSLNGRRCLHAALLGGLIVLAALVFLNSRASRTSALSAAGEPAQTVSRAAQADNAWPLIGRDNRRSYYNPDSVLAPPLTYQAPHSFVVANAGDGLLSPVVAANEQLYLRYANGKTTLSADLCAFELDGLVRWCYDDAHTYGLAAPQVQGNVVVTLKRDYETVVALNATTGVLLWEQSFAAGSYNTGKNIVSDAQRVYLFETFIAEERTQLTAYDLQSGDLDYRVDLPRLGGFGFFGLRANANVLLVDDLLIYEDEAGTTAVSRADGGAQWHVPGRAGQMTADANALYLHTNQTLYAHRLSDGGEQWGQPTGDNTCDDPATDNVRVLLLCPGDQTGEPVAVRAYAAGSGQLQWETTVGESEEVVNGLTWNHGALGGGFVYLLTWDQFTRATTLYSLDLETGEKVDQLGAPAGSDDPVAAAALAYDRLFVTREDEVMVFDGGEGLRLGYLPAYDEDGFSHTNPMADSPVETISIDGTLGAIVDIAATVITDTSDLNVTATLRIYNDSGVAAKQAAGQPDRWGNVFWSAPLPYAAAGYEYQVELPDGELLPRRQFGLAASATYTQDRDGLQWLSPPNTVDSLPVTLRLQLPPDFPAGAANASLSVYDLDRGGLLIPGQRVDDTIEFTLTEHNVVRGQLTLEAVATAGTYTAYSSPHNLTLTVGHNFLPGAKLAFSRRADGSYESVLYHFEETDSGESGEVSAEVADISPRPWGYRVAIRYRTPDPTDDPLTKRRRIRVQGWDEQGNPAGSGTETVSAGDGIMTIDLQQRGGAPIRSIRVQTDKIEPPPPPEPGETPTPPPPPPPASCNDPAPPDEKDDDEDDKVHPRRSWLDASRFHVNLEHGLAASGAYGVGGYLTGYSSTDTLTKKTQACVEYGGQLGVGADLGPAGEAGLVYDLPSPGPGFEAPASSGTKVAMQVAVLGGVKLSFTVPDNWERADTLGSISLGVIGETGGEATGSFGRIECKSADTLAPQTDTRPFRRKGGDRCTPDPPPPPGNPPDDTESVVLATAGDGDVDGLLEYWRNIARQARLYGFPELEAYAEYMVEAVDRSFRLEQGGFRPRPQAALEGYQILAAAAWDEEYPTVLAQWEFMADQGRARVLRNGFYGAALQMLENIGIPGDTVGLHFSPEQLGQGLLIIPSGGLNGLADVLGLKERLEEFVSGGGVLIVLSQPYDHSLDHLPGSWQMVGYENDVSCYWDALGYLAFHPTLASMTQSYLNGPVDGYLTAVPPGADALLQRTANGENAFAVYDHGAGHVLVTTLYDDWGREVGQSSLDVRNLFRDMVRWSLQSEQLPDVSPGANQITTPLTLQNTGFTAAAAVRYLARNPFGELVPITPDSAAVSLAPGGAVQRSPTFQATFTFPGIWQLNYQLLDGDGGVIQGETVGALFTVSDRPAPVTAVSTPAALSSVRPAAYGDAQLDLSLDQAAYQPGETVQLTLDLSVDNPQDYDTLQVVASVDGQQAQQAVSSQASQQLQFSLPARFSLNGGLIFYGVYDEASGEALYLNTRWLQRENAALTVTPDQPAYNAGDLVTLQVSSDAARTVFFEGPGLLRTEDLPAGDSQIQFTLPAAMAAADYAVRASAADGEALARFDVLGPDVDVIKIESDNGSPAVGEMVAATATIDSDQALQVAIAGALIGQDGTYTSVLTETAVLQSGSNQVALSFPFTINDAGLVRFELYLYDVGGSSVVYAEDLLYLNAPAPTLLAVRPAAPSLQSNQSHTVDVDWYNPGDAQAATLTVWAGEEKVSEQQVTVPAGSSSSNVTLPATLPPGPHLLYAVAVSDGLRSQALARLTLTAPESGLITYLPLVVSE